MRKAEIDDLTIEQIVCLHESVMDNNISPVDASESPALIRVVDKIEALSPFSTRRICSREQTKK